MDNIREQMEKRFDLLQSLEALRDGDLEHNKLVDLMSEFIVDRELMMLRIDEALHDMDTAIKYVTNHAAEMKAK